MNQYHQTAQAIIEQIGGQDNIINVIHCATRLRFLLKDKGLVDSGQMKAVDGVVGVVDGTARYQVIIGMSVGDVFKELIRLGIPNGDVEDAVHAESDCDRNDTPQTVQEDRKKPSLSAVVETISGCMTPMIPALTAAGIIKVILSLLSMSGLLQNTDATYRILDIIGDSAFYFMPFVLAFNAARRFRVEPSLALIVVGVLMHPNFSAWVASGDPISFIGIPVRGTIYAASVIPALLMVWVMSYIQRFVDRITPKSLKLILNPSLILLISAPLALLAVGPLGSFAGDLLSAFINLLAGKLGFLMVAILAAAMPFIVMTGMHHALTPIFLATFASTGQEALILVAQICANLAQAGATWAVAVRSRSKKTKQLATAAGISAIMGITEPAIYGITLKLKRPMIAAAIGAGIAGVFGGIMHVTLYVMQNSLMACLAFMGEKGIGNVVNGLVMMVIAVAAPFIICMVMGFREEEE